MELDFNVKLKLNLAGTSWDEIFDINKELAKEFTNTLIIDKNIIVSLTKHLVAGDIKMLLYLLKLSLKLSAPCDCHKVPIKETLEKLIKLKE